MRFENTYIPYGAYWSTPFCKWQGSLSSLNAVHVAAQAANKALAERDLSPEIFDGLVLGMTVPQKSALYGAPWLAAMIGAEGFNNFGSSLIFGHPQGPTGTRLVIELIEELAQKGGGHGLFVGCAAGDTAAGVVVQVGS